MWALGDYPRVAREVLPELGQTLVEACDIGPGVRVLDVAAGSGNVAVQAAEAGAEVVAADITPELLEAGQREAAARGVALAWVEADAQALPFDDGAFDVVTSSVGTMFAPDHRATAAELVRVCRPGGTLGLISWTPDGMAGDFFRVLAPHAPPAPPGAASPTAWGREEHVRELFGGAVVWHDVRRDELVVRHFEGPQELCDYYRLTFGPVVATYAWLQGDAEREAALDRELLAWATGWQRQDADGAFIAYEYLLTVGRTVGG